ncbi:transcription initiation factor TFIID subunit 11 [Coemansia sp. RSA 1933]|nr:transcription initiation factor TFIID subunit 11 [Coemansia sp. RSA 1933]
MDDFIVDDDSGYRVGSIREMFGVRYHDVNDDDDDIMEVSAMQQMREDKRSAKLGRLKDDEEEHQLADQEREREPKKRMRQTAMTPAKMLQQRKRRGGGAGALGRGGSRTPTKLRTSMSQGSLVLPDPGSVAEKRGRRGSTLGLTSPTTPPTQTSTTELSADSAELGSSGVHRRGGGKQRSASIGGEADDDDDAQEESNPNDTDLLLIRQSKEEIGELWDQMTEEQQQRYNVYRRTALNKGAMKKLVSGILNQQVSSTLTFVVAGFSKVFVGEIIERALQVKRDRGDEDEESPLTPEHLREAYRLYKKDSQIPLSSGSGYAKRLF